MLRKFKWEFFLPILIVLIFTVGASGGTITVNTVGRPATVDTGTIEVLQGAGNNTTFVCEDAQYLSKSGEPQIPWKLMTVLLPPNADMATISCSVVSAEYETIKGVWNVAPVSPILSRDADGNEIVIWPEGKTIVDGRDTDIYSADALWPAEDVQLTGKGRLRGWRLAEIAVPLILYNPVSGELQRLVYAEISVECNKKGKANGRSASVRSDVIKGRRRGHNRAKKLAVNFDDAVDLYTASQGGVKSELSDAPASDEGVLLASVTGTSGYVIITTNDIRANSTELADFVAHKQSMGFTVTVIDEDDTWAGDLNNLEVGDPSATKLREWLQANYSAMDLKYALIIGDPRIDQGYVPMKLYPCKDRNIPTDYFYAELTCDWDKDGDGIIGEWEDDATNGDEIERYFEVYVGRIPHYGVMADTDSILQKTMDYENSADTQWRRNTLISNVPLDSASHGYDWGEQVKRDLLEPRAISSDRVYRDGYGHTVTNHEILPPPEFPASSYPATVWSQGQYGLHVWSTHGWAEGASDIISSGDTVNLDNNHPSTVFLGACENAYPEFTDNLSYSILKNGGIVTIGATRLSYYYSQTDYSDTPVNYGLSYRYAKGIVEGKSCGEALWDLKEEISSWWKHNWTLFNPYGDPSVVVMPEAPAFTIIPTDAFYTKAIQGAGSVNSRNYTLKNNSTSSLNWTASKTKSWLSLSATSGSIAPSSNTTVVVSLNSQADSLAVGNYTDMVVFTDTTNNITLNKPVEVVIEPRRLELVWHMDETAGTTADDSSGMGHTGTLEGGLTFDSDSVAGVYGNAIELDGVDDKVIHTLFASNWPEFTVSMWVKAGSLGQGQWKGVFSNYDSGLLGTFQIDVDGASPGNYRLLGEAPGNFGTVTTDWVHLAAVCDGTDTDLYYNGAYVTTVAMAPGTFNRYVIGVNRGGTQYFNGSVDEVRVYNYALSDAEILVDYDGGKAENPDPEDGREGSVNGSLTWVPGTTAVNHDVYFGTSYNAVFNADTGSSEYKGRQSETTYTPASLTENTEYFWRIDEVTATPEVFAGDVWSFAAVSDMIYDLSLYWQLDGDYTDASGNGADGTASGTPAFVAGQIGQAVDCDGIDDKVLYTFTEKAIPEFTVSMWVKAGSLGQEQWKGVFNNHNSLAGTFQIDVDGASPGNYRLWGAAFGNFGTVTTDWVHLAAVCDGTDTDLYYNGAYVTTVAMAPGTFNRYVIGVNRGGTLYFDGIIDDVGVWECALLADDILHIYGEGVAGRSFLPSPDVTSPAAPTGLTATPGDATVSLNWDDNAEPDMASYSVYRSTTPGSSYSTIATGILTSDYVDNTVTNGTTYYYVAIAIDTSSNESGNSNEASATPQETTPPTPNPATFAAAPAADSDTAISMTATAGSDVTAPLEYLFTETSGNPGGTSSAWQTSTSYTDTGLTALTQYTYTVTMRDGLGNTGAASSSANATTQATPDTTPPTPNPATFAAAPAADSDTAISMTATTGSDASGPVEYLFTETSGNPGATSSAWQTSTSYTDIGLNASTQYTYTVTMRDALGNTGTASAPANATTDVVSGGGFQESGGVLSLEAESGTIGSRWITTAEATASGGIYVEVDPQYDTATSLPECTTADCLVTYDFNISTAGNYKFWFRIFAETPSDDSFFWRIDSGSWITENNRTGLGSWLSTDNIQVDNISTGSHVLEIAYRENGTGLDKFVIQLDSETSPTGNGPPESMQGGSDITPPTPNPATFAAAPAADSDTAISMTATTGSDASGPVEYLFTETSGNPGATSSGWQISTSYTDIGLNASTQYTYTVTMRDALINTGTASSPASATTAGGSTTDEFIATEDAYVKQGKPTSNYGSLSDLRVRSSSTKQIDSYLKFTVSGVGAVTSAKLKIYSKDVNMGVDVYQAANTTWSQGSITWNTAPGTTGGSLDNLSVTTGWVEFDVTALVTADGTYSFVLKGDTDKTGRDFYSSESSYIPVLSITHQ